jgi:hypothetical protein
VHFWTWHKVRTLDPAAACRSSSGSLPFDPYTPMVLALSSHHVCCANACTYMAKLRSRVLSTKAQDIGILC